jgi:hypothetical protein
VPDHSTFSKNRHGRFRDRDLLRRLFEVALRRCIDAGLVGGEAFAVDASPTKAEASRQKGVEGSVGLPPDATSRAITGYLGVLRRLRWSRPAGQIGGTASIEREVTRPASS